MAGSVVGKSVYLWTCDEVDVFVYCGDWNLVFMIFCKFQIGFTTSRGVISGEIFTGSGSIDMDIQIVIMEEGAHCESAFILNIVTVCTKNQMIT